MQYDGGPQPLRCCFWQPDGLQNIAGTQTLSYRSFIASFGVVLIGSNRISVTPILLFGLIVKLKDKIMGQQILAIISNAVC